MQGTPKAAPELTSCNCLAVRQAARRISQFYDGFLAPLGLRTTQYSVLAKLARLGALSISEIADSMVMDRTTTGRAIRPLERDGLVVVSTGDDGRQRFVKLTPAGQALFGKAEARWRQAQREFESAFGPAPAAQMRRSLKDMISALPGSDG